MFSCPNCLQSCLRAVAPGIESSLPRAQRGRKAHALGASQWRRPYATANAFTRGGPRSGNTSVAPQEDSETALTQRFKTSHLRKEVERLSDPVKLAEKTLHLLKNDQEEKALEIIKMAGLGMACVVSWNHVLNYNLQRQNVQKAWKLFNEMKKRGQKPDAYTFTIMLNGMAANADNRLAVEKAEAVYNSMYAPNSPVRPNMIHKNTMLKVCSRAGDLDKLFEVAGSLPATGKGSADAATYSIVLNAIHTSIKVKGDGELTNEQAVKIEQGMEHAKRIWVDVIQKWKDGELLLDENMVNAMGRILLTSSHGKPTQKSFKDATDVLTLIEQTMGIPEMTSRKFGRDGSEKLIRKSKESEHPPTSPASDHATSKEADFFDQLDRGMLDPNHVEEESVRLAEEDEDFSKVFEPIPLKDLQIRQYAQPTQKTLSLLLEACAAGHAFIAGSRYWDRLENDVRPDLVNCNDYLRLVRWQRNSKLAASLVRKMRIPRSEGGYGVGAQDSTFVLATSACLRDNKSPHVLVHALDIMEDMRKALEVPSVKAVRNLDKLLTTLGRNAHWRGAVSAIKIMDDSLRGLRSALTYRDRDSDDIRHIFGKDRSSTESGNAARKVDKKRGSYVYKTDVLEVGKVVESALMRTLDYFMEEMDNEAQTDLQGRLRKVRAWRQRFIEGTSRDVKASPRPQEMPARDEEAMAMHG